MTPAEYLGRCHFGDVRVVLKRMIADGVKVQSIITSPPYWNLRSYLPDSHPKKHLEIGQEPTLQKFITRMAGVFDLAREVLEDDGTLWMNMGDAYAGSWGAQSKSEHLNDGVRISGRTMSQRSAMVAQRKTSGAGSLERTPGLKPKDMMGQPWRLAFALQDRGWWLRQDIIWRKSNPMPESTRDRCTKSHEYMFLMTKSEQYYWDFDAAQEPVTGGAHARKPSTTGVGFGHGYDADPKPRARGVDFGHGTDEEERGRGRVTRKPAGWASGTGRRHDELDGRYPAIPLEGGAYGDGKSERMGRGPGWRVKAENWNTEGGEVATRNRRSVWDIPTQAYKEAHYATFPEKLVEPCILIGTKPGQAVLDIFMGSGTTGKVAQRLGRDWIGIELNEANGPLQHRRTAQQGLVLESRDA